jgi:hypothetical protein
MRLHRGRAAAVGLLCAVAATVGLWSGPLREASSAMHSGSTVTASVQVHGQVHLHR